MIGLTYTALFHAAVLSNFLYGALLLARSPSRQLNGAGAFLWVAASGAVGHLCYASTLVNGEDADGTPLPLLVLDILLVFASLWVFVLTFPPVAHILVDGARSLIGM